MWQTVKLYFFLSFFYGHYNHCGTELVCDELAHCTDFMSFSQESSTVLRHAHPYRHLSLSCSVQLSTEDSCKPYFEIFGRKHVFAYFLLHVCLWIILDGERNIPIFSRYFRQHYRKIKLQFDVHRVHRSHQCKALMAWVNTGSRHISLLSYMTNVRLQFRFQFYFNVGFTINDRYTINTTVR